MDSSVKEGKLSAIATHIRNISADKYKAELSLLSEKALTTPFPEMIDFLEKEIANYSTQISGLQEQYKAVELE